MTWIVLILRFSLIVVKAGVATLAVEENQKRLLLQLVTDLEMILAIFSRSPTTAAETYEKHGRT
jgi:hypothetical protein